MKLFKCQNCGLTLFFENTRCERCGFRLGYLPDPAQLVALQEKDGFWQPIAHWRRGPRKLPLFKFCDNAQWDVCNWLLPADSPDMFCRACRHNLIIPDLQAEERRIRWRELETAKHRLFYTLIRLQLPLADRNEDPAHGLGFQFLDDPPFDHGPQVMTGHDNGLITLALKEADDARREQMRTQMGEAYRTPLGHFRHEIGHHYWDILVASDPQKLDAFRQLFGDEQFDYGAALERHYNQGPPGNWQMNYVSAYATMHPWEDFAETWAHYLHIVDTLETASAFGLRVHPRVTNDPTLHAEIDFNPHDARDIDALVNAWLPLTFAVNSLNRSMGLKDLYPFVLSPPAIEKLGFIHRLIHT